VKQLDRLVADMRERRPHPMSARERVATWGVAAAFVAVAAACAFVLPWNRPFDLPLTLVLIALFAVMCTALFEIGRGFATPDELVFVPILYLVPLALAPAVVGIAYLLSDLPAVLRRTRHVDRWPHALGDSWSMVPAAIVVALLGPDARGIDAVPVFAVALVAQWIGAAGSTFVRERIAYRSSNASIFRPLAWAIRIDAILWPAGMLIAIGAGHSALALLVPLPLVWLLREFSHERAERYAAAVELNRAYRGTVAVLTDVVEAEDSYTAEHSRSVVTLCELVADELRVPQEQRQELEFAALLHDVGKIAIPREILNKPAALTAEEFELIKTHTIEGERILTRAGGLLAGVGTLVRSCHERWDGGGYPDGLARDQIPLAARIVFCCDAYNAMTTDRPYRRSLGRAAALEEIDSGAGTQFDPRVARALRAVITRGDDVAETARAHAVRAVLVAAGAR
jgi:HD-GYP domain-containing protein (c-di-GMP phosphodiesterase class II)